MSNYEILIEYAGMYAAVCEDGGYVVIKLYDGFDHNLRGKVEKDVEKFGLTGSEWSKNAVSFRKRIITT